MKSLEPIGALSASNTADARARLARQLSTSCHIVLSAAWVAHMLCRIRMAANDMPLQRAHSSVQIPKTTAPGGEGLPRRPHA
jgi:hypothetical protein